MVRLLVIADDFTGALDTGVQFVKNGVKTQIGTGADPGAVQIRSETEVLVLDLETRPLSCEEAYQIVYRTVSWAFSKGITRIYKKTDSALRGNIGSELEAVMDASGQKELFFLPAFPKMGRHTKGGVQYLEGIPLSETTFGRDLYEPITCSYIPDLIRKQSKVKAVHIGTDDPFSKQYTGKSACIYIFDARTEHDLERRLLELGGIQDIRLLAGCAGCAQYLPGLLGLKGNKTNTYHRSRNLLISCGSLNPITQRQLEYLEKHGIPRVHLTEEQRLSPGYCHTGEGHAFLEGLEHTLAVHRVLILDTVDMSAPEALDDLTVPGTDKNEIRFLVAASQGRIVKELALRAQVDTVLMTGGDTLMGFIKELDDPQLIPVCELRRGCVLSSIHTEGRSIQVISKSGGFGGEEVLKEIVDDVVNREQQQGV